MYSSPETDQLMKALAAMHKEFGVVISMDAKSHTNKYASLSHILQELQIRLQKHGLVLDRHPLLVDGQQAVKTVLTHPESKQWKAGISLLTPQQNTKSADQAYGGSCTYHYRYDAMALCGVFADKDAADTDGNYEEECISALEARELTMLAGDLHKKICSHYNIPTLEQLPKRLLPEVMKRLESRR